MVAFRQIESQSGSLGSSANISASCEKTVQRYAYLDHAKMLLGAVDLRNSKGKDKGKRPHRTRICHNFRAYGSENIILKINQNPNESRAGFSGLQTCGNIHCCPVCAQRAAADKGKIILKALRWGKRTNKKNMMLTLTASHNISMSLDELETRFKASWETFTTHRDWINLKKELGVAAWIANHEAPYGENGFHYHKHVVLFLDFDLLKEEKQQADIGALWIQCLTLNGLNASPEYAAKITTGSAVGDTYLTKCGITVTETNGRIEYEISTQEHKEGGLKTQWELLELSYYGNHKAGELFTEYAEHMSGKKFLTFSGGFSKLLKAEPEPEPENPEGELVAADDDMQDWAEISPYWWDIVRDARSMSKVLKIAAKTRSVNKVRELLWELQEKLINAGELAEYHRKFRFIKATSGDFDEGIRRIT
jgi:Replication protein